jgi:hypothetical protein
MNEIDSEKTDIDHGKAAGRLWAGIMSHRKSRLSLIARVAQLRDAGNMDCDAFRQIIDPEGDDEHFADWLSLEEDDELGVMASDEYIAGFIAGVAEVYGKLPLPQQP